MLKTIMFINENHVVVLYILSINQYRGEFSVPIRSTKFEIPTTRASLRRGEFTKHFKNYCTY